MDDFEMTTYDDFEMSTYDDFGMTLEWLVMTLEWHWNESWLTKQITF